MWLSSAARSKVLILIAIFFLCVPAPPSHGQSVYTPWVGTITYSRNISIKSLDGSGTGTLGYSLTIKLAGDASPNGLLNGTLSAQYSFQATTVETDCTITTVQSVVTNNIPIQAGLFIVPGVGRVGFDIPEPGDVAPRGEGTDTYACVRDGPPPMHYQVALPAIQAEQAIGSDSVINDPNNITGFSGKDIRPETSPVVTGGATLSWSFAYTPDLVLTLEPDANFDTWMPEAGPNESVAGNMISVIAHLRQHDGKPPSVPQNLQFDLVGTSVNPGLSMNYPAQGIGPNLPDMRFESSANPSLKLSGSNGQTAITTTPTTDAGVYVSSFDFGGSSTLKVSVVGMNVSATLLLPKRTGSSLIADEYKRLTGKEGATDDDDTDVNPVGGDHIGDGLTLFEEYRGFHVQGTHIRTDPKTRELFVLDKIKTPGAIGGISLYELATAIRTYGVLSSELNPDRVINFNHGGSGAHTVDQHGIIIEHDSEKYKLYGEAGGGPGTPKTITSIKVPSGLDLTRKSWVNSIASSRVRSAQAYQTEVLVAHELLHGSNVYHHGETDPQLIAGSKKPYNVVWSVSSDSTGDFILENGSQQVTLRMENPDVEIPPAALRRIRPKGAYSYIGYPNGQHSGDELCLMRYFTSQAYLSSKHYASRYVFPGLESPGNQLDSSRNGTGINDPSHLPESRYGPATIGNCTKQLCINDAHVHTPPVSTP
jgi:hypothetical protein